MGTARQPNIPVGDRALSRVSLAPNRSDSGAYVREAGGGNSASGARDRDLPAGQRAGREQQGRIETVGGVPDVDLEGVTRRVALGRDGSKVVAATTVDRPDALDLGDGAGDHQPVERGSPEIDAGVGIARSPGPHLGMIEWPQGVIGYPLRVIAHNPPDELELTGGLGAVITVIDLQPKR